MLTTDDMLSLSNRKITLTEAEKERVRAMGDPEITPEILEDWLNRNAIVSSTTLPSLTWAFMRGVYAAIKAAALL